MLRTWVFIQRLSKHSIKRLPTKNIVTSSFPDIPIVKKNYAEYLLENVNEYENHTAVVDGFSGNSYKYSEVLQITKNISSGLTKRGIGKGDVVCITLPNMPEHLFSMCGALATGAVVTFGNPAATSDEISNQMNNSKTTYIITSEELIATMTKAASLTPSIKDIYVVNGKSDNAYRSFNDDLLNDNGSASVYGEVKIDAINDTCILPYSSGTTGLPKGVMLSHSNVCTGIDMILAAKKLRPGNEAFLLVVPMFHVYGNVVIPGTALRCGNKMVILPKFDPETYLSSISKHKISYLHLVPPLAHFLLNHPLVTKYDLSSVEKIVCGAAPLDAKIQEACLDRMRKLSPNVDMIQGYGMTEILLSTFMPIKEIRKPNKSNSVGVLLPNTIAKVISENGEELGPGEAGELLVSSPIIMKGYLGNTQATDHCISNGWFHTGDIVSYDEDNYFYVIDRKKELIKYKGLQVAPAELEALLLSHPDILDCGVVGKSDSLSGELPMAFIVKKKTENNTINEQKIKEFVAKRVSDYKQLRGGVHFITEIPRSASGKILRKELRKFKV